jgi:hypothetical protein
MEPINPKTKLAALWLFILLNMIFRDLHQIVLKSELEMFLTGTYNGVVITEEMLLLGGLIIQVPIGMTLFSHLLTRRISRPVTVVAVLITAAGLLSNAPSDMDDVLHLTVELVAFAAILWTVWTWPASACATA